MWVHGYGHDHDFHDIATFLWWKGADTVLWPCPYIISILSSTITYPLTVGLFPSFFFFTFLMMLFVICVRLLQPHTQGITRQWILGLVPWDNLHLSDSSHLSAKKQKKKNARADFVCCKGVGYITSCIHLQVNIFAPSTSENVQLSSPFDSAAYLWHWIITGGRPWTSTALWFQIVQSVNASCCITRWESQFAPPSGAHIVPAQLPDEYFTPTPTDLKAAQATLSARTQALINAPLQLRAVREAESKARRDRWPEVLDIPLCKRVIS